MTPHDSSRDDIAELAALVDQLADHLERLQPDAAGALDDITARAARLRSPDRGPTRLRALSADSISVTEPDGRVRLVIAGEGTFPTEIQMGGQVIEHPRQVAGMLFFNDEGDECGGLIFSGAAGYQGGSLTFDKYHGDQVIQFWHEDSEAGRMAALVVVDQPDVPFLEMARRWEEVQDLAPEARAAAFQQLADEGLAAAPRMVVGRVRDGSARVSLAAADGKDRIVVAVTADGTPSIRFLDADQNVTWQAP